MSTYAKKARLVIVLTNGDKITESVEWVHIDDDQLWYLLADGVVCYGDLSRVLSITINY